jgi:hypothetical protein
MTFRKKREPGRVDFCDRCGSVCDARCRADAARRRSVESALRHGFRL